MQIALNDQELGALVELLYKSLRELQLKIALTEDPEMREALRYREGVLQHLVDHLMSFSVPQAA